MQCNRWRAYEIFVTQGTVSDKLVVAHICKKVHASSMKPQFTGVFVTELVHVVSCRKFVLLPSQDESYRTGPSVWCTVLSFFDFKQTFTNYKVVQI